MVDGNIKRIAWICLSVLVCIILSGCTSEEGFEEDEFVRNNETDEITWLSLYSDVSFWKPLPWDTTENTITGDITKKTQVAVDVTIPVGQADKMLSLMLLNDELPDLIAVTDAALIGQLTSSGKVWDLEELLLQYCPDSHLLSAFPEDIKQALIERDGAWYAYPSHINSEDARKIWKASGEFYTDYETYSDNNAIIWNRAILEKLELDPGELKTEEQVLDALDKAAHSDVLAKGKKIIPLLIDGTDYKNCSLKYLWCTFGGECINEDGDYEDIMLQPETKHALSFLNLAVRRQYLSPEQMNLTNMEIKERIADGNVLCFIGNIANAALDPGEWISTGAIYSGDGKAPVLGKNRRAGTGWMSTFVSKSCRDPEKAAKWIDYMTSDEGMRLWNYGYEGVNYTLDEDGLIVRSEQQEKLESNYDKTGFGTWWIFDNTAWERSVLKRPEEGDSRAKDAALHDAYGKDEKTLLYDSSALVMTENVIPKGSQAANSEEAVEEWENSQIPKIIMAENDELFEKEYETFIRQLEELGIHKIDQIKNAEYMQKCDEYQLTPKKRSNSAGQE